MITRIVKMKFQQGKVDSFTKIFYESNPMLHKYKGCLDVKLLKDPNDPSSIFTLSYWDSLQDLDDYRNSPLFKSTWTKMKALFDGKAEVWSLEEVEK